MTPPDTSPSTPLTARGSPVALSLVSIGVFFLVLVLGNAALTRVAVRADLTEDRVYSLSPATRRVLAAFTDPVAVRVYWGDRVPTTASLVKRRLRGLLEEYQSASNGRLRVDWIDTSSDEGRKEAEERDIVKTNFQVVGASNVEMSEAFNGLAITYEDRTEILGPLVEVNDDRSQYRLSTNLEYELTTALWKIGRREKVVVGLVQDAPANPMLAMQGRSSSRFQVLSRELQKTFGDSLKSAVDLDEPVPPEVGVLLVAAPKDWPEKKAYHLEQFVLRGGKALLLLDGAGIPEFNGGPLAKSGLEDWLKAAGLELLDGVVGDFGPKAMSAFVGETSLEGYPYWPRLLMAGLDQGVPATKGIDGVPLYWPRELSIDEKVQSDAGRSVRVLGTTSEKGVRLTDTSRLRRADPPAAATYSKRVVLAMVEGPFTSFWKGKPTPDEKPPEPPPASLPTVPPSTEEHPAMGDDAMDGEPGMDAEPAMDADPAMDGEPAMDADPAMDGEAPPGPAPGGADGGHKGPEGEDGATPPASGPVRLDQGKGVLVILTDADTVSDPFSGTRMDVTGGLTNVVNGVNGFRLVPSLVEWLTGSEDLIALRARSAKDRKFEEAGEEKAVALQWTNLLAPPLVLLLLGGLVFVVRRYRS